LPPYFFHKPLDRVFLLRIMRTFSTTPWATREARKPIPKGVDDFETRCKMRTSSSKPVGGAKGEKESSERG
jgi:hypothetical protein